MPRNLENKFDFFRGGRRVGPEAPLGYVPVLILP